ncbi:hypothetical protein EYZ11_005363 [Aspergillus tanneri]|uniref:Uncharacterized protein n=1 Tax=Aspergillus tanneri TaxID=1220188 RepID=A0A4S3JIR2_9EURO|nr:uncharacterized protein ATNIH1004_004850 [Aspergillus tanneri]KAA8648960.1 hypothetical protein ATNIH1004_004850 [Aspergillus tanneri]THC95160.1 hypothetical protein EYZ11_005363 [Aspergillus tanneri]
MYIPPQSGRLDARQYEVGLDKRQNNSGSKNNIVIICAACISFTVAFILMMYFALRALRRMNCRPKYIPGKYLKDKWNRWPVGPAYGQVPDSQEGNNAHNNTSGRGSEMNTNSAVRRDTSVRSVITLPAYSSSPKPTEQVIAREGERGGMDVVLEFPETADEEEARREELMDSLYQIRQQRRQEQAEREARRQERREARARGDYIRLEQLRMQSRARTQSRASVNGSNTNLTAVLATVEQQSRGRDRRISSVSYAALGQVRHDGSRVRARSPDSDRHPLLSNTDSINTEGPDRSSGSMLMSVHSRGESYSSMQSTPSETDALTRHHSQTPSDHSAGQEGDVGSLSIPPPDYEHLDWGDAPPYESPVLDRGERPPQLRELTPLPTIQIDMASPASNTPTTPTSHQPGDENRPPEQSLNLTA